MRWQNEGEGGVQLDPGTHSRAQASATKSCPNATATRPDPDAFYSHCGRVPVLLERVVCALDDEHGHRGHEGVKQEGRVRCAVVDEVLVLAVRALDEGPRRRRGDRVSGARWRTPHAVPHPAIVPGVHRKEVHHAGHRDHSGPHEEGASQEKEEKRVGGQRAPVYGVAVHGGA